jgi:Holliday junction resolvase RusA-like endonuclease
MKSLTIFVPGLPVAQPRPRAVAIKGKARMYSPGTSNEWKACVIHALRAVMKDGGAFPAGVPLRCDLTFYLPRPKGHFGSGKNADKLKASAPTRPTGKPDRDNLDKAVCDAITASGVWADDSQVTDGRIRKRYAGLGYGMTGCEITITEDIE